MRVMSKGTLELVLYLILSVLMPLVAIVLGNMIGAT